MAKWGGVKKCPACLENTLQPADAVSEWLAWVFKDAVMDLAGWRVCHNSGCGFVFDAAGEIVGRWMDGRFEEVV